MCKLFQILCPTPSRAVPFWIKSLWAQRYMKDTTLKLWLEIMHAKNFKTESASLKRSICVWSAPYSSSSKIRCNLKILCYNWSNCIRLLRLTFNEDRWFPYHDKRVTGICVCPSWWFQDMDLPKTNSTRESCVCDLTKCCMLCIKLTALMAGPRRNWWQRTASGRHN